MAFEDPNHLFSVATGRRTSEVFSHETDVRGRITGRDVSVPWLRCKEDSAFPEVQQAVFLGSVLLVPVSPTHPSRDLVIADAQAVERVSRVMVLDTEGMMEGDTSRVEFFEGFHRDVDVDVADTRRGILSGLESVRSCEGRLRDVTQLVAINAIGYRLKDSLEARRCFAAFIKALRLFALIRSEGSKADVLPRYFGVDDVPVIGDIERRLIDRATEVMEIFSRGLDEGGNWEGVIAELGRIRTTIEVTRLWLQVMDRRAVADLDPNLLAAIDDIVEGVPITNLLEPDMKSVKDGVLKALKGQIARGKFPEGDDVKFELKALTDSELKISILMTDGAVLASLTYYVDDEGYVRFDWLMADPDALIPGLTEAFVMRETLRLIAAGYRVKAEVRPPVKICRISIERLGYIAYASTDGDLNFKERYWRVMRDETCSAYRGKNLSEQEEARICSAFVGGPDDAPQVRMDIIPGLTVVMAHASRDEFFLIDLLRDYEGEIAITRAIPDLRDPDEEKVFYVVENLQISP